MNTIAILGALLLTSYFLGELAAYLTRKKAPAQTAEAGEKE